MNSRKILDRIKQIDLVKDTSFLSYDKFYNETSNDILTQLFNTGNMAIVYICYIPDLNKKYDGTFSEKTGKCYSEINKQIIDILKGEGVQGKAIVYEVYDSSYIAKLSLRTLAVLSGLGTIGLNMCLINKDYGCNVVIGLVLSDLVLEEGITENIVEEIDCSMCYKCIEECPVHALTLHGIDANKCYQKKSDDVNNCNMACISSCPYNCK